MSITTSEAFAEASALFLSTRLMENDPASWLEMMVAVLHDSEHDVPKCILAASDLFPNPTALAVVAYTAGVLHERERIEGGTL